MPQDICVTDELVVGLYLMLLASRELSDGVRVSNPVLQKVLGVQHVHEWRAKRFAMEVKHLFPYHKVQREQNNVYVLYLGLIADKRPRNPLRVNTLSALPDMKKELGF
jgi:hypothetical protein